MTKTTKKTTTKKEKTIQMTKTLPPVNHNKPSRTFSLGFWKITKFFDVNAFEWLKVWMTPNEWRHLYAFDIWKWSFVIIRRNR